MDYNKLNFLDMWIVKGEHSFYTDLYIKSTDRNTLLKANSYHPLPLKNSLPYSQFCRLKRICKKESDFQLHLTETQNKFRKRGYGEQCIEEATNKMSQKSRSDFFIQKTKKEMKSILFSTKYTKKSEKIKSILRKHWHILQKDKSIGHVYKDPPNVVFRRGRNLRDELVHSEFISEPPPSTQTLFAPIPDGNYKCGACAQCSFTTKKQYFNHPHSGKQIKIKGICSCHSKGIIYMLTCPCGKAYVGKTSRELKVRISEHRSSIRTASLTSPVAQHFVQYNHLVSSLRYTAIEKVERPKRGGNFENIILKREAFWISHLNTLSPNGLNQDFDLRPFL